MTTLLVPHACVSTADVRHALVSELRERGVPEPVVDDAALVLSELVGNAVRHGAPIGAGTVRASWWVAGGAVHLEVCDGGPGLPGVDVGARLGALRRVPAVEELTVPVADEGGRGLPLVDLLSARWGTTAPGPTGVVAVYAELPLADGPTTRLSRGGRSPEGRPLRPWGERTAIV
jgi:anti-sigma regulatory factor (Ser/Thr protein kinase)